MQPAGKGSIMTLRTVKLIAEIDEFKGFWKGMQSLPPETLSTLRVFATLSPLVPRLGLKGRG